MAGAQSAWGVDIGVSSLKAIKLHRDGERVDVEAFEVIEHEKFLTEAEANRDAITRQTLQKFLAKHNVRREKVYIGVPGSSAFARFVKLPPVEPRKIPEIVRFEAIQQIPFPLEQVNWDYQTFQHPDSPDVEVGIFAMKKELVAQILSNFQAQGMMVEGVQMSPLAVYNAAAFENMTGDKGTILIDMGAEHTDLVIMDQGRVWLRTINLGGNHFTDALAKSFKRSFTQAEQLKKTAATSKYQKQIYQAMRPIFTDLTAEIQRSIGFYNSTHRDSRLERIVGMGNPFKLPNLQKYLQQELKLEVTRLENFGNATADNAAALNENILSLTASYGLALQALGLAAIDTNLLPVEIARKMLWRGKQPWFIAASALVALGAGGMVLQWYTQDSAFAAQQTLREQNNSERARADELVSKDRGLPNSFDNDLATVRSQLALAANRSVWPLLMNDVFYAVPQANRQTGTVVITGVEPIYFGSLADHKSEENASTPSNPSYSVTPGAAGAVPPGATPFIPAMSGCGPVPMGGASGCGPMPTVQPAAQPVQVVQPTLQAASATPVTLGPGESNHGFIVTVYGYCFGQPDPRDENRTARQYLNSLMQRAQKKEKAEDYKDRPYYFSEPWQSGQPVARVTGAVTLGRMGTVATAAVPTPWGNTRGPYWDAFVPEIVKPPETPVMTPGMPGMYSPPPGTYAPGPGGGGAGTDLGGPVDAYSSSRAATVYMYDHYLFTLKFKVHLIEQK